MHYNIVYHINLVLFNPRTKERKGIISYYQKNEKATLRKHVNVDHVLFAKIIEEELSSLMKIVLENNLQKRNLMCLTLEYQSFLVQKIFLIKMLCKKSNF
jgi:hypothetical protein